MERLKTEKGWRDDTTGIVHLDIWIIDLKKRSFGCFFHYSMHTDNLNGSFHYDAKNGWVAVIERFSHGDRKGAK